LSILADALAEASARRPDVVLLAGEPGIGKTRLLKVNHVSAPLIRHQTQRRRRPRAAITPA